MNPSSLAANAILDAFRSYLDDFTAISRRARTHFEDRRWDRWQADAVERLAVRETVIRGLIGHLLELLGPRAHDIELWLDIKAKYSAIIAHQPDMELTETFFNSVTRRMMGTVGVNANLEYIWLGATMLPGRELSRICRRYPHSPATADVFRAILSDYSFAVPWADLDGDAALLGEALDRELHAAWESPGFESIEMLRPVFYRNKGAYLIGRIRQRNRVLPLILPLLNNDPRGVTVDALLASENEASKVFSFTRAYFHVDADNPVEIVGFLKSLMPLKPTAELFTAMGWNKHGKTMLYRALYRHLGNSSDRFEIARGARGMVMSVFSLPSYDIVFKVIRDRFAEAKTITRADVLDRYQFVFRHDRVGRMVDAQEFENLTFHLERFTEPLLEELLTTAGNTVKLEGEQLVVRHAYTERRLYPLDLYIKEMRADHARDAINDYGVAIADLAAANIFPGDLFIKNFGVTRHNRVVFYDYDEVCLLSDCNFRRMPRTLSYDDEVSAQPWFSVAPNDVFPEEFRTFLWLPDPLRQIFEEHHSHLFDVDWWIGMQQRVRAGEILDVFPYDPMCRLRPTTPVAP